MKDSKSRVEEVVVYNGNDLMMAVVVVRHHQQLVGVQVHYLMKVVVVGDVFWVILFQWAVVVIQWVSESALVVVAVSGMTFWEEMLVKCANLVVVEGVI